MKKASAKQGIILINVIVFAVIVIVVGIAFINFAATLIKSSRELQSREQALQIAEAGIDYYRWHLAHAQSDYKDGNASATSTGPFIHNFTDKNGTLIGQFALTITPAATGSTIVKIKSKGTVTSNPAVSRSVQVTLAIPSVAKYAIIGNSFFYIGSGTQTYGPVASNLGIHFEGVAHNQVTSAVSTTDDPDVSGTDTHFGVFTSADPTPPAPVPTNNAVFLSGRQFPVPAVDFAGFATDLAVLKSYATSSSGRYFAPSGTVGYHIILKTNDTFDLYKVNSVTSTPSNCSEQTTGWGTWTISSETFVANYAFPSNGIIFSDNDTWVDGQINSAHLTIVAGETPDVGSNKRSIIVNHNLLYTNFDGTDSIALIAQQDINAGLGSDDTYTIDAAMVAELGRIGRYHYSSNCGTGYTRTSITLFGMLASALRYGFAFTDGTGYVTRILNYDANLLYSPPPGLPQTSNQYVTLSWDEVN